MVKLSIQTEVSWIVFLRHFSTLFGYIWPSVSTAGGTNCSWEWTSNLPLAADNYLSWDSNPKPQRRVVFKARRLNHSATEAPGCPFKTKDERWRDNNLKDSETFGFFKVVWSYNTIFLKSTGRPESMYLTRKIGNSVNQSKINIIKTLHCKLLTIKCLDSRQTVCFNI